VEGLIQNAYAMIVVHSTNNDVVCEMLVVSGTVEERERGAKVVQRMRAAIVGGSGLERKRVASTIDLNRTRLSWRKYPPPPPPPRSLGTGGLN